MTLHPFADVRPVGARLPRDWSMAPQGFLRLHLGGYALAFDSTHELARMLRPPGTTNGKYGNLVVLEDASGPRRPERSGGAVRRRARRRGPAPSGDVVAVPVVDPNAEPPFGKFATLCRTSSLFAMLWRRELAPKTYGYVDSGQCQAHVNRLGTNWLGMS